jgi:hypothetical protein
MSVYVERVVVVAVAKKRVVGSWARATNSWRPHARSDESHDRIVVLRSTEPHGTRVSGTYR